jgi:hypothetical protein
MMMKSVEPARPPSGHPNGHLPEFEFRMTDITPLIPTAGSSIAPFSIGFANLSVIDREEDAAPAGSGALVSVGSIHGILTAAHVLEPLPIHGEVGVIRFTSHPMIQKQTLDMSFTDRLLIHGNGSKAEGPDLGFLRLASPQVAILNATNVFFNLSKREDSVLGREHPSSEYFEGVSGIVAEWTIDHQAGGAGFRRLKGFSGLFGVGYVSGTRECNGYDLVDFETKHGENSKAPLNYKGTSGGALWRVYITKDSNGQPSVADKRIVGVAFHQSDLVDGARTITCHGPKSIYGALLQAIRNKWPGA